MAGRSPRPRLLHRGPGWLAGIDRAAASLLAGRGLAASIALAAVLAAAGAGFPFLAFVLALILAGYTVWDLDRLSSGRYRLARPPAGSGDRGFPLPAASTVGAGSR